MLSAESESRGREMEVGVGDGASAAGDFGACSVRECEDVHCFRDVGAVAGEDWVTVAEAAASITGDETAEARAKGGMEKGEDAQLSKLHS